MKIYIAVVLLLMCSQTFAQSSSSSSASSVHKFDLRFGWKVPTEREDGTPFYADEIAGYEIRYKKVSELVFKTIPNLPPTLLKYQINNLTYDDYYIEISVFDQNGLYSKYVSLQYLRPPEPVTLGFLKTSLIR